MTAVIKMEPVQRWLDNNLARGLRGPFAIRGALTPELARLLMERNEDNRTLSAVKCEQYAADIKTGQWTLNGETVIVSEDGSLNNGQHRCVAVLLADTSIETFFVFGVQRPSRLTLDQGIKRTVANYLQMESHKNTNVLAAAAAMCDQYERLGVISRTQIRSTPAQTRRFVEGNPGLMDSVAFVCNHVKPNVPVSVSVLAGLHFLFSQRDDADDFVMQVMTGTNLSATDPVFVCRNALVKASNGKKRMPTPMQAECIVRAWNARREGRSLQRMRLGPQFPAII